MQRLTAARERAIGREILTLPLMAASLAGGFATAAGSDVLYPAIQAALAEGRFQVLGAVSTWTDLETPLISAMERLIDFVTVGEG